jgi:FAD/FMN-containing dehydrogenase
MEDGIVDDAVIAANLEPARRRSGSCATRCRRRRSRKAARSSTTSRCQSRRCPNSSREANAAVVKLIPGARPVPFGHLGDGNIHYNVSQPVGGNAADFLARWHDMNAVVFEIVLRMGGSISAEHGIGVLKRDELPDVKDKVAIELMRSIKAMLDPHGIMNPGKVL